MLLLNHIAKKLHGEITLTASKSESNRALIIQALCDEKFKIENLAEAEDTQILKQLLADIESEHSDNNLHTLCVGLAGTVMRFMTAYLSIQDKKYVLTGEQRMKERPIKILVDVLNELGADISYQEKEDYPPLSIIGCDLKGGSVKLDVSVSSQYISALLMIAPTLKNGLQIEFKGELISKPYVDMTISMMRYFGAEIELEENSIKVKSGKYIAKDFTVEGDWSAASYWYSMVALAREAEITLYGLKKDSLQGDAVVAEIYKKFGVETTYFDGGIRLTKICHSEFIEETNFEVDFSNCPDIAQTVAVTCAVLNVKARLTGLKTLRIKETDRITALQNELNKLGFNVEVDGDDLLINRHSCESRKREFSEANLPDWSNKIIKTYNDHRMAMAFAPLSLIVPISIENPEVVNKSYPNFWEDISAIRFIK